MTRRSIVVFSLFAFILASTERASGQSTQFVYQGQLQTSSSPANGTFDFEFGLYSSPSGGSPLGPIVGRSAVSVASGIFSVELDFGDQFSGSARYLEIRVRQGGGAFTALSPRQQIASTPYAVKSSNSDVAATAANSNQLGGVAANQYVVTTDPRMTDSRPPTAGSPNYIQNQNAGPQASSNFNISGSGTAGGILSGFAINATDQYYLNFGRVLSSPGPGTGNLFLGIGPSSSSGNSNTFVGYTGISSSLGSRNTIAGTFAGQTNSSGSNNSFFGYGSGSNNVTGTNNTAIGYIAQFAPTNLTNATAIGANAQVTQNNSLVLGSINGINSAAADTNVGIGTTAPSQRLHVVGNGLFTGNLTVNGTLNANISGNFIQNTSTVQPSSNFNISGNGIIGSSLGIGTSTPNTQVHMRANAPQGFAIQMENTNTAKRLYIGNYGATGGGNHWPGLDSANTSFLYAENKLVFTTPAGIYFSGSTTAEHMRITPDGNVGIGTMNPDSGAKLHIVSLGDEVIRSDGIGSTTGIVASSGSAQGVYAVSQTGRAVVGQASTPSQNFGSAYVGATGIWGTSAGSVGVFGTSDSNVGLVGVSNTNIGVLGRTLAVNGVAGKFEGRVVVTALASGSIPLCFNAATSELSTCSSSLRYKTKIGGFRSGLDLVKRFTPITFDWKDDGVRDLGLVAEDVAAIEPLLVTYKDGRVEGVRYEKIGVVLINAVKEQQDHIDSQQKQIDRLTEINDKQQRQLDALKALVCAGNRLAPVCKTDL